MSADLKAEAERAHMALAEAGYPHVYVAVVDNQFIRVHWNGPRHIEAWARALDLIGRPRRCLPCMRFSNDYSGVRRSPDCEGTGRCADA